MLEYFRDPEMTAETLTADGWVRTGDLGTLSAAGYLQVTGRLKDMIIRGGENVYAREIEDCLAEHPQVAEAVVIGVPDDRLGEEIAAFVRVVPGALLTEEALDQHARAQLARHKVPRYWRFVDALPLTPNGKIMKYQLRAQFAAE
jgi:fatty-acyl-CoA synthase